MISPAIEGVDSGTWKAERKAREKAASWGGRSPLIRSCSERMVGGSSGAWGAGPWATGAAAAWRRGPLQLLVGPGRFAAWAGWAELGLAAAGTATEQVVGLGIPALSLPGPGPQFKRGFAERQSRLLGGAVAVCRSSEQLRDRLGLLLRDGVLRGQLGAIGRRRMGPAGGSDALARLLAERLLRRAG